MQADNQRNIIEPSSSVHDDEHLLRTNYAPQHIVDGRVTVSAIAAKDLTSRGFSVDREQLSNIEGMANLAQAQMKRMPTDRKEAFVSRFNCGEVRAEVCEQDAELAFIVDNKPIVAAPPYDDNPAHVEIRSAKKRSPSMIKALKLLLVPHLNRDLSSIDEYQDRHPSR